VNCEQTEFPDPPKHPADSPTLSQKLHPLTPCFLDSPKLSKTSTWTPKNCRAKGGWPQFFFHQFFPVFLAKARWIFPAGVWYDQTMSTKTVNEVEIWTG
jgi:hypothetical protein